MAPYIPLAIILSLGIPILLLSFTIVLLTSRTLQSQTSPLISTPNPPLPGLPLPHFSPAVINQNSKPTRQIPKSTRNTNTTTNTHSLKPFLLRLHPGKSSPLPREFYDLPPRPSTGVGSVIGGMVERARGKFSLGPGGGEGDGSDANAGRGEGNASMPALSDPSLKGDETTSTDGLVTVMGNFSILAQAASCSLIFGITYLSLPATFTSHTSRLLLGISISIFPIAILFLSTSFLSSNKQMITLKTTIIKTIMTVGFSVVIGVIGSYASRYALIGITGSILLVSTILVIVGVWFPDGGFNFSNWWKGEGKIKLSTVKGTNGNGGVIPRLGLKPRDKRATKSFFSGNLLNSSILGGNGNGHGNGRSNNLTSPIRSGQPAPDEDEAILEIMASTNNTRTRAGAGGGDGAYDDFGVGERSDEEDSWVVGSGGVARRAPRTVEELKAGSSWLSSPSRRTEGEEVGPSFSYDDSAVSTRSPPAPSTNHTTSNSWLTSDESQAAKSMSPWSYVTAEGDSPRQPRSPRASDKPSMMTSGAGDEPSVIRNYDPADMSSASDAQRYNSSTAGMDILPPLARRGRVASDSSFYSAMEIPGDKFGDQSFPRSVSESFSEDDLGLPRNLRPNYPAPDDFAGEELRTSRRKHEGGEDEMEEEIEDENHRDYARSPSPIGQPPAMPLPTLPPAGELRRSSSFSRDASSPFRSQKPSTDSDQTITQYAFIPTRTTAQSVPPSAITTGGGGSDSPFLANQQSSPPGTNFGIDKYSSDPLLLTSSLRGPTFRPGSRLDMEWETLDQEAKGSEENGKRGSSVAVAILMLSCVWMAWALSLPLVFQHEAPSVVALVLYAISLVLPIFVLSAIYAAALRPERGVRKERKIKNQSSLGQVEKSFGLSRIMDMSSKSIRPDSVPGETRWVALIRKMPSLSNFGYGSRAKRSSVREKQSQWNQMDIEAGPSSNQRMSRIDIERRMSRPTSHLWVESEQAFTGGRLSRAFNFIQPNPRISVMSTKALEGANDKVSRANSPIPGQVVGYPLDVIRAVSPSGTRLLVLSATSSSEALISSRRHSIMTYAESETDTDDRRQTFRTMDSAEAKSLHGAKVVTAHRAQRSHSPAFFLDEMTQGDLPADLVAKARELREQRDLVSRPDPAYIDSAREDHAPSIGRPRSEYYATVEEETQHDPKTARRRTLDMISSLWSSDKSLQKRAGREDAFEMGNLPTTIPSIKIRNSFMTLRSTVEEPASLEKAPAERTHSTGPRPSISTHHESIDLTTFRPSLDFISPGNMSHGQSSSLDIGKPSFDLGEASGMQSTPVRQALRHRSNHSRNLSLPGIGDPTFKFDRFGRWADTPVRHIHDEKTPPSFRNLSKFSSPPEEDSLDSPTTPLDLPPFPAELIGTEEQRQQTRSIFPCNNEADSDIRGRSRAQPAALVEVVRVKGTSTTPLPIISEETLEARPPLPLGADGSMDEAEVLELEKAINAEAASFESGMFADAPDEISRMGDPDASFDTQAAEVMEQIMAGPAFSTSPSDIIAYGLPHSPRDSLAFMEEAYASVVQSEEWSRAGKFLLSKKSSDTIGSRAETVSSCVTGASSPTPSPMHGRGIGPSMVGGPSSRKGSSRPGSLVVGRPGSIVDTSLQVPNPNPRHALMTKTSQDNFAAVVVKPHATVRTSFDGKGLKPLTLLGERAANGTIARNIAPNTLTAKSPSAPVTKLGKSSLTIPSTRLQRSSQPTSILKSRSGPNLQHRYVQDQNQNQDPLVGGGGGGGRSSNSRGGSRKMSSAPTVGGEGRSKVSLSPAKVGGLSQGLGLPIRG